MDRHWDVNGAASAPAVPVNVLGPNVYPQAGVSPSMPGPWWFHMVTEEMRSVISAAGLTPDRADLTQLVEAIDLLITAAAPQPASIQGVFKNLQASATGTNATVTVSADEIAVESTANAYKTLRGVALSINSAAAGANGLDTGVLAASTWYSVWVIWNGTTTAGLLSLSETAPTLPSGYTHKARVGWIRTDGTANKYPRGFKQYGKTVRYVVAAGSNVPASPSMAAGVAGNYITPTWVAISVSSFVPPTATKISILANQVSGGSNGFIVAPNASYGTFNSTTNPPPVALTGGSVVGLLDTSEIALESANIYWASNAAGGYLFCNGWEDS